MDRLAMLNDLSSRDANVGYAALCALVEDARACSEGYALLDDYAALLADRSAYLRIRGVTMLAENARWDAGDRLTALLPQMLALLSDEKPIVVRKAIDALTVAAQSKPSLAPTILAALEALPLERYRDSMRPLIAKDAARAMTALRVLTEQA